MNNEDKILEILMQMQQDISGLKQDQADLRAEMSKRFDAVDKRFDKLESDLKYAWQDIALVEKRIKQHEKEYHEAV